MSETTRLKLFKHDNVETNTNQFDIEESLNENWDKLDEFAEEVDEKTATQNTSITSNTTEIEKLKTENEMLRSQIPTRKNSRWKSNR